MGAGTLFQRLYTRQYPKKSYADKAVRYQDAKKLNLKALKNAERSLENGEATVMPGPFVKDPQIEKHIRSVNKYNKTLDDISKDYDEKADLLKSIDEETNKLKGSEEYRYLYSNLKKIMEDAEDAKKNVNKAIIDFSNRMKAQGVPSEDVMKFYKTDPEVQGAIKKRDELEAIKDKSFNRFNELNTQIAMAKGKVDYDTERALRELADEERDLASYDPSDVSGNEYRISMKNLPWTMRQDIDKRLPQIAPTTLSNVNDITRYHTTKMKNLPYIFTSGLETGRGGQGYGGVLLNRASGDDIGQVYTTSRAPFYNKVSGDDFEDERWQADYSPYDPSEITLRLDIPKKDYRKLQRTDWNPEQGIAMGFDGNHGSLLQTIQEGGRTDIFEDNLPSKYITKGINDSGVEKDLEDIIKNYECGGGYDDDCADWQDALIGSGLLNFDDDGNEEWNQKLFEKIRAARNNAHKR